MEPTIYDKSRPPPSPPKKESYLRFESREYIMRFDASESDFDAYEQQMHKPTCTLRIHTE